jgi:hypothetical protein
MANKAKQRAELKAQEAMEAGMVNKAAGKAKRRASERKAHRHKDRGLNEAKGFTPGLMRVSKPGSGADQAGHNGLSLSIAPGTGRGRSRSGGAGRRGGKR